MKRLPILFCLPALVLIGACSNEPSDGTTVTEGQNDAMTAEDDAMMMPEETPTTNGNGNSNGNGNGTMGTDGSMGTDGAGASTGTMDGTTPGPMGNTTGTSSAGTSGTGTGTGSSNGTTTGTGSSNGQGMPPQ